MHGVIPPLSAGGARPLALWVTFIQKLYTLSYSPNVLLFNALLVIYLESARSLSA